MKHLNSQQINYATFMIILTPTEREILQVFFKEARAQSYRGLPLGSSRISAAVALVDRDIADTRGG
jgi:hypothetical protein